MVLNIRKGQDKAACNARCIALLLVCVCSLVASQDQQFPQDPKTQLANSEGKAPQCQQPPVSDVHWFELMKRSFSHAGERCEASCICLGPFVFFWILRRSTAASAAMSVLPVRNISYSPMNVQPPTSSPSFRGWFMRVVDHEHRTSVALVIGAFARNHKHPDEQEHYVVAAVDAGLGGHENKHDIVWNATAFPPAEDVQLYSDYPDAKTCNVVWKSRQYGTMQIRNDTA